jgi:hypothetical protein
MITWHIGTKCEIKKDSEDKDKVVYKSEWYNGTESGSTEHTVNIYLHKDGTLSIWNNHDSGAYLYPEQVEQLKNLLIKNNSE